MIKLISLLVTIFSLSLAVPILAAEAGDGTISGQLVNGTANGGSVAGQTISLKTYLNDAETGTTNTKTNAEGQFVFSGLATASNYSYDLLVTYQEAEYNSERLSFDVGKTSQTVTIPVYDSTTSDAAIKIATAHTIVYVGQGGFEVMEFYLITNESDRTYIGSGEITTTGKRRTVTLPLVDRATGLQYGGALMECCVLPGDGGFIDTMPVLPGSKEIIYAYQAPYRSTTYTFSRKMDLPIVNYSLLIQSGTVKVASQQLTTEQPINIEDTLFNRFSGGNFAVGDTLEISLSELPSASRQGVVLGTALGAMVAGIGISYIYLRKKRRLQPAATKVGAQQTEQKLLAEVAQLDDDFEGGKIDEQSYRRLRAQRKAQLVALIQRSKEKQR